MCKYIAAGNRTLKIVEPKTYTCACTVEPYHPREDIASGNTVKTQMMGGEGKGLIRGF